MNPVSLPSFASRRVSAKLIAATAAAAVAATVLGVSAPAIATPASPVRVFTESGGFTAEPANAISAGWWGHEGAGRSGTSVFSLDGGGGAGAPNSTTLAAQLAKIGPDATLDDLHVAFVLTSSDGSAEKPAISANETVGQAFGWFDASTAGSSSLAGNTNSNDYVDALSTESSYNAWYNAGQLAYGFDDNLVPHDATQPGDPASGAHAIGTSILNTWPAGTHVSLVYYVSTSTNAKNEPIVTAGPDGHAETAWVPLTTVALPSDHSQDPVGTSFGSNYDTVRTSAGYVVNGAAVAPTVTLKDSWSAGAGTLTASITDSSSHVLTNATGSVQFQARAVGASGGTFTNVGSPVTVNSGVATAPITGLTPGQFQEFQAVYTPDSAASSLYTTATSNIDQAFDPYTTTTTVSVAGTLRYPYKQTLGATVTSTGGTPTGTVTFLDKGASIGTVALNSSGHASLVKGLAIGTHLISVRYNGASTFGTSTSAGKSVVIGKDAASIALTFSPSVSRFVHGSRPKVTVTVKAYGLTPAGTVTIAVYQPNRKTITLKGTLRYGKVTFTLPALLRGTTKLTVKYLGSSTVAAATTVYSFKVTR